MLYAAPHMAAARGGGRAAPAGGPTSLLLDLPHATAEEVLTWYAMRWSVEVTFHDSKQHLGFEQPQGWTRRAVERTAPVAMLLYSLDRVVVRAEGHRSYHPLDCPWYRSKTEPSFADMLATLTTTQRARAGFIIGPRRTRAPEKSNNSWKTRSHWPPKVQKSN